MTIDLSPIWLTLRLAAVTTGFLLAVGIPLSYWLSRTHFRLKPVIETLVSLPLVLPPSVIGFYLLIAFSPAHFLGGFFEKALGIRLAFSFAGLVIASVIYALPFMIQPLQAGFAGLPASLAEAAATLGKSRWRTLLSVELPNMKGDLLAGIVLTFAHCLGEFGVVLMVGGNIPGRTRLASIAIYDEVEALHYNAANIYALILFAVSFVILLSFHRHLHFSRPRGLL